jgi:AmmeMemoRadiSam system protein B
VEIKSKEFLMKVRKSHFSGTFYPNSCEEIEQLIQTFNQQLAHVPKLDFSILKAIIAPHAGYIYSGFTANMAYRSIDCMPKRIIVIGPTHKIAMKTISVALYDALQTPCGNIKVDTPYALSLQKEFDLVFNPIAHEEHSVQTQLPFIKHYFPNANVVELVYGQINFTLLSQIISKLMLESHNLVVISTDLSHFYSQEDANYLDNIFLQAIQDLNLQKLDSGCEACGMIGVKALVDVALKKDLQSQVLDYKTSMNASGDASRVVGYMSALFGK